MLTKIQEINLKKLAEIYNISLHDKKLSMESFFIINCYKPNCLKQMLETIVTAIVLEESNPTAYANAKKACSLFENLYRTDANFAKSLVGAWSTDPVAIKQFEKIINLEDVLLAKLFFEQVSQPEASDILDYEGRLNWHK